MRISFLLALMSLSFGVGFQYQNAFAVEHGKNLRSSTVERLEKMRVRLDALVKSFKISPTEDRQLDQFERVRGLNIFREIKSYGVGKSAENGKFEANIIAKGNIHNVYSQLARLVQKSGKPKAVAFDLDDTIFISKRRTHRILQTIQPPQNTNYPNIWSHVISLYRSIKLEEINYDIEGIMADLGLKSSSKNTSSALKEIVEHTRNFWTQEFFSVFELDEIRPGITQLLEWCKANSVSIFYVTARRESKRDQTAQQLNRFKLPLDASENVIHKDPSLNETPAYFKSQAMIKISQNFEVIGIFDDNYENLSSMSQMVTEVQGSSPLPVLLGEYNGEKFRSVFGKTSPVMHVPSFKIRY